MIQRIQSVYLLLITLFCALCFFIPMGNYDDNLVYTVIGIRNAAGDYLYYSLPNAFIAGLSGLLSLITVFMFRNRMRQLTLCKVLFVLLFLQIVLLIFVYPDLIFNQHMGSNPMYTFGIIFPALAFLLVFLASRAIRKDEDKVRAVDRIR